MELAFGLAAHLKREVEWLRQELERKEKENRILLNSLLTVHGHQPIPPDADTMIGKAPVPHQPPRTRSWQQTQRILERKLWLEEQERNKRTAPDAT